MVSPDPHGYERLGKGYSEQRRADPRIQSLIDAAVRPAQTVLNVGAGTGSYEPAGVALVALEPSLSMIRQRPAFAAPAIRGVAEQLPFGDRSFDVVLGILTLHHWLDWRQGLAEARRVAPRRMLLVHEPAASIGFWLVEEYLPVLAKVEEGRPTVADIADELGADTVQPVPVPYDCTDGFLCAFWRRPEAYLDPVVRRSISSFAMVSPGALESGLARLARDIRSGAWHRRHRDLLDATEIDLGYRLVVSG